MCGCTPRNVPRPRRPVGRNVTSFLYVSDALTPVAVETQASAVSPVCLLPVRTDCPYPPVRPSSGTPNRQTPRHTCTPWCPCRPRLYLFGRDAHTQSSRSNSPFTGLWNCSPNLRGGGTGRPRWSWQPEAVTAEAAEQGLRLRVAGEPVLGETSVLGAPPEPGRHGPCPGPSPLKPGEPCVLSRWLLLTLFAPF